MLRAVQALKLPPSALVLDLASGPGEPALTIAAALPQLRVVSTDVSPDMVSQAAGKAAGMGNLTAQVADSQDLSAFADDSVDVVTCCYGFMFPAEKVKALAEARRVLKPGGMLIATYWTRMRLLQLAGAIMGGALGGPAPPPPANMNPLSLREAGAFDALCAEAGFAAPPVSVTSEYPFDMGADAEFQFKCATLVFREKLEAVDPAPHPKARAAFEACKGSFLERDPEGGEGMVVTGNEFVMATLVK